MQKPPCDSFRIPPCALGAVLLLVVDLLEIGVDHLVVAGLALAARAGTGAAGGAGARPARGVTAAGSLLRLVHGLAELHRGLAERLGLAP